MSSRDPGAAVVVGLYENVAPGHEDRYHHQQADKSRYDGEAGKMHQHTSIKIDGAASVIGSNGCNQGVKMSHQDTPPVNDGAAKPPPTGSVTLEGSVTGGSYQEVGSVPGTYRIIDLYCLKEVLNQIMRCSCESDQGFAIFQGIPGDDQVTFHSILDILCKNCKRKICFGTSILRRELGTDNEPEIDMRLDNVLGDAEVKRDLWNEFYKTSTIHLEDTIILNSTRLGIDESTTRLSLPLNEQQQMASGQLAADSGLSAQPKYQCHVCSKLFRKQYNLQEHMRIHTGDTIPCHKEGCNKQFKDKSTMNKHVKAVHLKETPHSCTVCGRQFKRREHLNHHYAIHTGDKKFTCEVCSKSFSFHSTLQKHKLTHSTSEMVKCSFCWKEFKTEISHRKHVNKFHPLSVLEGANG